MLHTVDFNNLTFSPKIPREGEKWRHLRKVLNQRMLHPKDSALYADTLNEIVSDFVKRIYYLRALSPTGDLVTDVANEFYSFSLEGTFTSHCTQGLYTFCNVAHQVCVTDSSLSGSSLLTQPLLPYYLRRGSVVWRRKSH